MSDCQTLASAMFFKSDWLELLLEDCIREGIDYKDVKLLKAEGRTAVWNICSTMGCLEHGVPGQTCRLIERYLFCVLRNPENVNDSEMQGRLVQIIISRLFLIMTCCAHLSAKMCSAQAFKDTSVIKRFLLAFGESYTVEEIKMTEAEIFKTLGFRLPLWTSVDIGMLLALELKLPNTIVKAVVMTVDLAEFYRADIENKVLSTASLSTSQNVIGIRTLHLAAGSVAAAVRLFKNIPDPVPFLASLLQLPDMYIQCIRDPILKYILEKCTKPRILKRKHETPSS